MLTVTEIVSFAAQDEDLQNLRETVFLRPHERLLRGFQLYQKLKKLTSPVMHIADDFILELIKIFQQSQLRFLVVGGYAVSVHGYVRASDDFDIWLDNTTANLSNFRRTLMALGIDRDKVYELVQTLAKPNDSTVYRFKIEGNNVDFLMQLKGLSSFEEAYQQRFMVRLGQFEIPFIALEDLLRTKQATNRTKDQLDLEMLLKIKEELKRNL
ncbi:MAG: hypothetical protein MUE30_10280 [Spirosomaceae bacterium]|jgi:hypothetical protein|nr:hypothetical protein [Spirosomataceae bacterium]